jgi:two-component system response regulator LytT
MNILIVEDELRTAKSLQNIILGLKPEAKIVGQYQSAEKTVRHLSENIHPDLIFMDIQLADGLCFKIFKSVKITCPVVFCTAFDDYSLEAFKTNGIDYILKPFSKEDVKNAFNKVDELKNFFQQKTLPNLEELAARLNLPAGKTSFLVFKNQKYTTVPVDNIAYFYIQNESATIKCFDKQEFPMNNSLDQVASMVSAQQFYRINRQYLVNFKAIKEIEHFFLRKLLVELVIETPDKLLINKEKVHSFLSWMENR